MLTLAYILIFAIDFFTVSHSLNVLFNANVGSSLKTYLKPEIKKNIKLPVWPVWGGVLQQLLDWAGQPYISSILFKNVGGRVVPLSLEELQVSPFLLLAHHCHSFTPFDPFRKISEIFISEGFPAHPHSGFDTVTYCLDGGFLHRDSEGMKMSYGDGDVQWMRAGRGIIHEEMWDNVKSYSSHQKIEIFQIWVNLPQKLKANSPAVKLIKSSEIPDFVVDNGIQVKLIAGTVSDIRKGLSYEGPGNVIAGSPTAILHITVPSKKRLELSVPKQSTSLAYIRAGSATVRGDVEQPLRYSDSVLFRDDFIDDQTSASESNPANYNDSSYRVIDLQAEEEGVDLLLLVGEPLGEPVLWNGPFVQENERDLYRVARVFARVGRSGFWDFRLTDSEWLRHVKGLDLQRLIDKEEEGN